MKNKDYTWAAYAFGYGLAIFVALVAAGAF